MELSFAEWSKKSGFFALIIKIVGLILFFFVLFSFIFGIHYQTGNNMYPKIEDGDLVLTYRLEKPQTNDAVLYKNEDGKIRCGRIVALPNENVQINQKGELLVNGYVRTEEIFYPTKQGEIGSKKYKVPANSYFILNDFRSNDKDSRKYGSINQKQIKGKVIFVIRHRGF